MAFKNFAVVVRYFIPLSAFSSSPETLITLAKAIFCLSLSIGFVLLSFPQQYTDGNPVPILIFEGHPSMFDAFVASIIFSFIGSISALLIGNKPRLEILRNCYLIISAISIVLALSVLAYLLFVESSKLFYRGC